MLKNNKYNIDKELNDIVDRFGKTSFHFKNTEGKKAKVVGPEGEIIEKEIEYQSFEDSVKSDIEEIKSDLKDIQRRLINLEKSEKNIENKKMQITSPFQQQNQMIPFNQQQLSYPNQQQPIIMLMSPQQFPVNGLYNNNMQMMNYAMGNKLPIKQEKYDFYQELKTKKNYTKAMEEFDDVEDAEEIINILQSGQYTNDDLAQIVSQATYRYKLYKLKRDGKILIQLPGDEHKWIWSTHKIKRVEKEGPTKGILYKAQRNKQEMARMIGAMYLFLKANGWWPFDKKTRKMKEKINRGQTGQQNMEEDEIWENDRIVL